MAGANVVEKLLIAIGLDTSGVDKGMNSLTSKLNTGLKGLAMNVLGPALGAIASGALFQSFVDEIGVVNELSKTVGVAVEELGAWKNALIETGADATKTGDIFRTLNQNMIDGVTRGRGVLKKYADEGLLPSFVDANGAMKDTEQYLLEISDTLAGMDTRTATGIMKNIAGVTDTDTVEFLQQGSVALRNNLIEAKRLGVLTKEDVKVGKDFDASVKAVAHSLRMLLLPVFRVLAPALLAFSNGVRELIKHSAVLYPALIAIGAAIGKAILPMILQASKAMLAFMATPQGALIAGLILLGLLLEDFLVWLDGGESAFGDFYETLFGGVENVKGVFSKLGKAVEWVGDLFGESGKQFAKEWGVAIVIIGLFASAIAGLIAAVGGTAVAVGVAVAACVGAFVYLKKNWDNIVNGMANIWNGFVDKVRNFISYLAEKVPFAKGLLSGLSDMAGKLKVGGAGGAVPASATNNNTTSNNANVDQKITVNMNNPDAGAVERVQNGEAWSSGAVAQYGSAF